MTAPVAEAVERGIAFLVSKQDPGGAWTDWALPPGPSSEWTTAYVGFRLGLLPVPFRARADRALARAADWLGRRALPEGWGYNPTVPPDADSTALATLCLAAVAGSPPPCAPAALRRFQRADGGFATYPPDGLAGSWGRSHPEVTANAIRALLAGRDPADRPRIDRAIAWLLAARRPDGTWDAFWWRSGLVATEACLAALRAAGTPAPVPAALPRTARPGDSFEAALLLSALAAEGGAPSIPRLAAGLVALQDADGGWSAPPALRITRRDCDTPWAAPDAGPLFADPRRLFTTATVVAALAMAGQPVRLAPRPRRAPSRSSPGSPSARP